MSLRRGMNLIELLVVVGSISVSVTASAIVDHLLGIWPSIAVLIAGPFVCFWLAGTFLSLAAKVRQSRRLRKEQ